MLQVEKHKLAKVLAGGVNRFDDDEIYIELQKTIGLELDTLGTNAHNAICAAYIFSRKVPANERQDVFQDIALAILEHGTVDDAFAYAIARQDWRDWYRKFKLHSQFEINWLSDVIANTDGEETELAELLVGEIEFEQKQIDKLDAQSRLAQIPENIKQLVLKRLAGKPLANHNAKGGRPKQSEALNATERKRLNRWVKTEGYKLLIN